MKITRRDLAVLLYLVAILSIVLARQLYYTPTMGKVNSVQEECKTLQRQVNELEEKVALKPQYEEEIAYMEDTISQIADLYPDRIPEEAILMYIHELNEELDMGIESVSMGSATPVYYIVGTGNASDYNYTASNLTLNLNYSTDYAGLKKIINYINQDEEHRNIFSLSIDVDSISAEEAIPHYDENGNLIVPEVRKPISGSIVINLYTLSGQGGEIGEETEPSAPAQLPSVEHGVDDIFHTTLEAMESVTEEASAETTEEETSSEEETSAEEETSEEEESSIEETSAQQETGTQESSTED